MIIFSVDGHHLAFFYMTEHNLVSFAIRNKAALRTLMQIYLAIGMALHNFFFARSVLVYKMKQQHFIITFTPEVTFFLK